MEPAAQPVPLGVSVYVEHGGAGGDWVELAAGAGAARRERQACAAAQPVTLCAHSGGDSSALAGLGALLVVLASVLAPGPFVAFGQRVVDGSDLAQMAFAGGAMFWSYQAGNLAAFGVFALASGVLVWVSGA